jgi:hypothetical protein
VNDPIMLTSFIVGATLNFVVVMLVRLGHIFVVARVVNHLVCSLPAAPVVQARKSRRTRRSARVGELIYELHHVSGPLSRL